MPVAVTTLRTTLATALVDNTKWQTFAFPPATVLANSVIVSPDDPYLTPSNNQHITISPMANFKIIITVVRDFVVCANTYESAAQQQ